MADQHHRYHRRRHHPRERHRKEALPTLSTSETASLVRSLRSILMIVLAPLCLVFCAFYTFFQRLIIAVWKPTPPPKRIEHPYARIAIIGAGLTGVSSAAHAISHGFEVVIFEADGCVGGVWAHQNTTSGLQINSLLYRFHPAVLWRNAYPQKDEILSEIKRIWKEYRLEERTRFNTRVTKVVRVERKDMDKAHVLSSSLWHINDGEDGPFDAIIVTVGTCGEASWVPFEGMPADAGNIEKSEAGGKSRQQELAGGTFLLQNIGDKHIDHTALLDRGILEVSATPDQGEEVQPPPQQEESSNEQWEAPEFAIGSPTDSVHMKLLGSPVVTTPHDSDTFRGRVLHSSQLDYATPELVRGKTVVVIGGGASAVEAVETAFSRGASRCIVLARDDKWIIPRNIIFDVMIAAAQPFGRQLPMSFLWERFLRFWQYHGVEDLVPTTPIFSGTPVVNDEFLGHVRSGKCVYVRGETLRLTRKGVLVNVREWIERGARFGGGHEQNIKDMYAGLGETDASGSNISETQQQAEQKKTQPQDPPHIEDINADLIVLATGYERPPIDFLPHELFPEEYDASAPFRPNLYLQNFSTEDWSVLMTNSAYENAIGTVGHFHIGIYMRILLTFLLDPDTRPTPKDMKLWVDVIHSFKRGASGGALGFFTYMELMIWLLLFHLLRPDRLPWMPFILAGWGVHPDDGQLLRKLETYQNNI
ncbi:FAD/NAD(P)-binding domain-containing protein [Gyrodon lividus]|nr:FAD/NAD(P)-binding domain-containing protein [Gyrodon lividus]